MKQALLTNLLSRLLGRKEENTEWKDVYVEVDSQLNGILAALNNALMAADWGEVSTNLHNAGEKILQLKDYLEKLPPRYLDALRRDKQIRELLRETRHMLNALSSGARKVEQQYKEHLRLLDIVEEILRTGRPHSATSEFWGW